MRLAVLALSLAVLAPSFASAQSDAFWGHVGAAYGRAKLGAECPSLGDCDRTQNAWKIFAGGRFNRVLGGEVSYLRAENFRLGSGDTDVQLVNLSLLAGIPFGLNSSLFGKVGALWGRTETSGSVLGLADGSRSSWGPSFGIGAQMGVTRNVALRLDLDRFRPKFASGERENLDTVMLGIQYSFGN